MHNDRSVLLAEVTPSRGERGFRWLFHPAAAISPRMEFRPFAAPPGYTGNPPPTRTRVDGIDLVVQPLLAGGQTVTAYREKTVDGGRALVLNVAHSFPEESAQAAALAAVRAACRRPVDALLGLERLQISRTDALKNFSAIDDTDSDLLNGAASREPIKSLEIRKRCRTSVARQMRGRYMKVSRWRPSAET